MSVSTSSSTQRESTRPLDLADDPDHHKYDSLESATILPSPIRLCGKVVHGEKKGPKCLQCPTANLDSSAFEGKLTDNDEGVYIAFSQIDQGEIYPAVLSVGKNPSFNAQKMTVEVYILHDFRTDFHGSEMCLVLVGFLRKQSKANSTEELKQWIERDIRVGKNELQKAEYEKYKQDDFFKKPVSKESSRA